METENLKAIKEVEKNTCNCEKQITISGCFGHFQADDEPYESGVYEDVTEEEEAMIENMEIYLTATLCSRCRKVQLWSENGDNVGVFKI